MSMTLAYGAPTGDITDVLDSSAASPALDLTQPATTSKPILPNEIDGNITHALDSTTASTASDLIQAATPGKPILRNEIDNTPGKCCSSDLSKRCCPYDYDGNKCEISDNRTLCGYNKNQEKPIVIETTTVKYGLNCWPVNDRLECGYDKRSPETSPVTQETITTEITTSVTSKIITTDTITTETTTTDITNTSIPETTTGTAKVITEASEQTSNMFTRSIPENCCSSNFSKKCCPYDYDDSKCEVSDNRTVCGFNKNPKTPENNETTTQFTKQGLLCQVRDERVECGYSRGSEDTVDPPTPTKPLKNELLDKKENPTEHKTTTPADTSTTTEETKRTHTRVTRPLITYATTKSTTKRQRQRRTTIECVEIHSKKACRVIRLDEELDYD